MAKKEEKTNAMRMLDKARLNYDVHRYDCDDFITGTEVAQLLNQPYDKVFKTIVVQGNSKNYYVFCLAVDKELERLKPLIELGGYIPCPDHRLPPEAKWENVQYYCEQFRKMF